MMSRGCSKTKFDRNDESFIFVAANFTFCLMFSRQRTVRIGGARVAFVLREKLHRILDNNLTRARR